MLGQALLFAVVPVTAAALSGAAAVLKAPGERLTSACSTSPPGVVIAAAAIELLPDALRQSPVVALTGFAAGSSNLLATSSACT